MKNGFIIDHLGKELICLSCSVIGLAGEFPDGMRNFLDRVEIRHYDMVKVDYSN